MEPKELSPDVAGKILDADFQNVVRKVAAGKPLTVAERSRICLLYTSDAADE